MLPNHDELLSTGIVSSTKSFLLKVVLVMVLYYSNEKNTISSRESQGRESSREPGTFACLAVWEGRYTENLAQSRVDVGSRNWQTMKWSKNQNMIKETYKVCGKHIRKTICLFQKRSYGRKGQQAASKGERQIHDWMPSELRHRVPYVECEGKWMNVNGG